MDRNKLKRDITKRIGRPRKLPLRNEDGEAEGKQEDVSATQSSTEDNFLINEYEEGCEYDQKDNCEYTVLSDAKKH